MAAYYMPMRFFGAGIRLVFVRAAAKVFHADVSQCYAKQHRVYGPHGLSLPYHLLLLPAKGVPLPTPDEVKAALKTKKDWRYIGTDKMPFVDARDMVTGKAVYGADKDPKRRMLTAMIERCPVANGTLKSYDPKPALGDPGRQVRHRGPAEGLQGGDRRGGCRVRAARGGRRHRGEHLGRPAGAPGRSGPRSSGIAALTASYDSEAFRGGARSLDRQARQDGAQQGGRRPGFRAGREGRGGGLPRSAPRPGAHGAASGDRRLRRTGSSRSGLPPRVRGAAQHYLGLYLLEPDPLKWLVWQAEKPTNVLKPCEKDNQQTFNDRLAQLLHIDVETLYKPADELKKSIRDRVKVHVTLLGGSFGGNSNPD